MPRLSKSIPSYRKHRASGQAVVCLNGRDFYLGPWKSKASKIEYDRLIGEWLQNGRRIRPDDNDGELTVVELLSAYLGFAKQYYRKNGNPTSELPSIKYALRYVRMLYGRKPCSQFGPIALQSVMQRMVDDGLKRGSVNQNAGRIKRAFKWGASQELIPASIHNALATVTGLRRGRTEAKEANPVLPVDDAVVDATVEHMPEVTADMVRLQRLTGMRPQEVVLIRPMDIDRSADVWTYRPESHKTEHHGRQRVVFIGPQAQGILLKYLARDTAAYCFQPCDSEAKRRAAQHAARQTPLLCGHRPGTNRKRRPKWQAGNRYDTNAYRRAIHRACDLAFPWPNLAGRKVTALPEDELAELRKWQSEHRWSPNRLRHSHATRVRRDFGLEAAQIALGHAAADVTQVYAERDLAKGIEVARKIG